MPENAAQLHGLRSPLSNAATARVSGYEPSRTGKPQLDLSLAPNTTSKYSRADGTTPEDSDTWVWAISICGLIKTLDLTLSALQSSSSDSLKWSKGTNSSRTESICIHGPPSGAPFPKSGSGTHTYFARPLSGAHFPESGRSTRQT